jgi:hypothetical protein
MLKDNGLVLVRYETRFSHKGLLIGTYELFTDETDVDWYPIVSDIVNRDGLPSLADLPGLVSLLIVPDGQATTLIAITVSVQD